MSEITTESLKLVRTSPGLGLVAVGFGTIYFVVDFRNGSEPTTSVLPTRTLTGVRPPTYGAAKKRRDARRRRLFHERG
jgi:hypothetical protein